MSTDVMRDFARERREPTKGYPRTLDDLIEEVKQAKQANCKHERIEGREEITERLGVDYYETCLDCGKNL